MGVDKIIIPYVDEKVHNITIYKNTTQIINHYIKTGSIDSYEVKMFPARYRTIYVEYDEAKTIHVAFCAIKYALAYDFIINHDFDEITAVNKSRFQNI